MYPDLTIYHHSLCHHPGTRHHLLPGSQKWLSNGSPYFCLCFPVVCSQHTPRVILLKIPLVLIIFLLKTLQQLSISFREKLQALTIIYQNLCDLTLFYLSTLISYYSLLSSLCSSHMTSFLFLEHALPSTSEPLYLLFTLYRILFPADTSKDSCLTYFAFLLTEAFPGQLVYLVFLSNTLECNLHEGGDFVMFCVPQKPQRLKMVPGMWQMLHTFKMNERMILIFIISLKKENS